MSQAKFIITRITKSKVIHVQIPLPKWAKKKNYKSGQGFQIGAKRFQIWAEITNRGKGDFKMGQGKILTRLCIKFETSAHEQIGIIRC